MSGDPRPPGHDFAGAPDAEAEPPLFEFEMQEPLAPAVAGRFEDLAPRLVTAAVLVAVGLAAIWTGGVVFAVLIALIVGTVIWELATMVETGPKRAWLLGGASGGALLLSHLLPIGFGLPLMMLVPMLAIATIRRHRRLMVFFPIAIMLAGLGLTEHLINFGFWWMIWFVLVVIASDVMGYFAGRILGGPKFWPRVSPKKTWSGTIAGWLGAAVVGLVWVAWQDAGWETVGISVALAMMAQMGDIAESAVKRRVGVKDSSNLLPGHGGLFDRFDAMLGAALMLLVIESVAEFPPVPGVG